MEGMPQAHPGTTTTTSSDAGCGERPPSLRRDDWDYPTTEVSAAELRAKIAELRSSKGAA